MFMNNNVFYGFIFTEYVFVIQNCFLLFNIYSKGFYHKIIRDHFIKE